MRFTGLTDDEKKHARELIEAGRCAGSVEEAYSISATFYTQSAVEVDRLGWERDCGDPNFTVAVLQVKNTRVSKPTVKVGVAKRDPRYDKLDVRRGRMIAMARALSGRAEELSIGDLDYWDEEQ